ncbi:MAG: PD40 domain-containing protein, partial [Sedimentisphaerales bacterium]|nr:PD40 domain-containing protein [Sedimentisphaerales bacterium]
ICSGQPGGSGGDDIWVLKRATVDDDWGPPENLGPLVNSANSDAGTCISADGLTLYFNSDRPGGCGGYDLYVTTRATRDSPWGPPANLGSAVNSSGLEGFPWMSSDSLELYFLSGRAGGYGGLDLYVCRRADASDTWANPVNLGPVVNSPYNEAANCLSPDGRLLVFQDAWSLRPGGYGNGDLWMTRRADNAAPWEEPVNLGLMINGPASDWRPCLSPDGSALYFIRNSGGMNTHWRTSIIPTVDFNADGEVDLTDLVLLIDNWGTDNTLYDIGPFAWGDRTVDIEDLKVFIAEWEKENSTSSENNQ